MSIVSISISHYAVTPAKAGVPLTSTGFLLLALAKLKLRFGVARSPE